MDRRTRRGLVIATMLAVASLAASPAFAGAGDLDPSFSDNGWVRTLEVTTESNNFLPEAAESIALQPDGKMVVTGEIADGTSHWYWGVFRYLPNGELDPTFGEGGFAVTNTGDFEFPHAVALQSDGKIVVAGEGMCPFAMCFQLVRYEPDGDLDTTFGDGGIKRTMFPQCGCAIYDIAVTPSDKIVAAGVRFRYGDALDDDLFAVARYTPDGRLDDSFSHDGKSWVDFGFGDDIAGAVALLPRGKVVAAGLGTRNLYRTGDDFAVARWRADGTLDRSFSGDGLRTVDFGAGRDDYAKDVAALSEGDVVLAGAAQTRTRPHQRIGVVRLNGDGSIAGAFGLRRTSASAHGSYGDAVAIQGDRGLLVGGRAFEDAGRDDSDWVVLRYGWNGRLDETWSGNGIARTDFGTGEDAVRALAVQGDGKPVAAGAIYGSQGLARYLAD